MRIGSTIARIGNSSYTLGQAVFLDKHCVATAEIVTVRIDAQNGRPMTLELEVRVALDQVASVVV